MNKTLKLFLKGGVRGFGSPSTSYPLSHTGLSDWLAETNLVGVSAQPAKLTSVNHRVVMEIAPEGTQYPGSATTVSHLLFHVNRPFLYLVRDEISGALLVMGRVLNPKDLRK